MSVKFFVGSDWGPTPFCVSWLGVSVQQTPRLAALPHLSPWWSVSASLCGLRIGFRWDGQPAKPRAPLPEKIYPDRSNVREKGRRAWLNWRTSVEKDHA